MEAYKVWATLNLKGDAIQKMQKFVDQVAAANALLGRFSRIANAGNFMGKFNDSLNQSSTSLSNVSRQLRNVSTGLEVVSAKSKKAALSYRSFAHGLASGAGLTHMGGMGAAAGGFAIAAGVSKAAHVGSDYQKQLAMLQLQNIPGLGKKEIENYAYGTHIKGVSRIGNLESLNEAASITKNSEEAQRVATLLSRFKLSASSLGREGFNITPRQALSAVKVAEIVSGSKDADVINKHVEMMFQSWLSSGGLVDPSQYLSVVRSARGYAKGMDPKFFYFAMEPLIQEYGSRVGPMIAQFYQHMKAGKLTTDASDLLGQGGLIKPGFAKKDKAGRFLKMKPGGMKGLDLMGENIFAWLDKYYTPFLDKMGAKTPAQREAINGKIFQASDAAMVNSYYQQMEKFKLAQDINAKTGGIDATERMLGGMHTQKYKELEESFTNLFQTLDKFSGPLLDGVATGLTGIFKVFDLFFINLEGWIKKGFDFLGTRQSEHAAVSEGERVGGIRFGPSRRADVVSGGNGMYPIPEITLHSKIQVGSDVLAKVLSKNLGTALESVNQTGTSQINPNYAMVPGIGQGLIGQN